MKQADFAEMVATLVRKGEPFAVATVVKTEGSTLGKPGFKVIISDAGAILFGSLGGVCPESAIVPLAKKTIRTGSPRTAKVFLENVADAVEGVLKTQDENEIHVESNCGGMMEIYLEPYLQTQRLIIIGQGGKNDVEDSLSGLGKRLGFEVVVIDHNPILSEQPDRLIQDVDFDLNRFSFLESDSVAVLTHAARDVEILQTLSKFSLKYVGLLGSEKRVMDVVAQLRERGIAERFISSLRAPIGIDIGSVTPAEIALSIMAEIVAAKHGKTAPKKRVTEDSKTPRTEQRFG